MLGNIVRALRLPFISASILPFTFGSLIERANFNLTGFILGFIAAILTHLSSNLINDYADSKSGADWQDKNFYKFFGGSKLIQQNVFPEKFYLTTSAFLVFLAVVSVVLLAVTLGKPSIIGFYAIILFLGWFYSQGPFQFSYRMLGEIVIFLLFGPALVMGGYFIQTGIFPSWESFILSLPFGFFTTAILFCNEIPDFNSDQAVGKRTWVSLLGPKRSFILYCFIILLGFLSVVLAVAFKYLSIVSLFSLPLVLVALKAAGILKRYSQDKAKFIEASKLTIAIQVIAGLFLILGALL